MKTITIRPPDIEASMLMEVQKKNQAFRDLQGLALEQLRNPSTWDYPDSVDRCQGSTGLSVRVLMNCCS